MIARRLGLEQLVAGRLALGVKLADALLFLVREARGPRSCRNQYLRQMPEAQCADQQAGDDLVADAEQQRASEHRMAKGEPRALRDVLPAAHKQVTPPPPLLHTDTP